MQLVEVVYPLKQGLKLHHYMIIAFYLAFVEVVYPLKQGLKLALNLTHNTPITLLK